MTKPKETQEVVIDADDIADYLAGQDDFALEMRCLRMAVKRGFKTEHGGTYTDPTTGKLRQFDLRLSKRKGKDSSLTIRMAVECKSLRPTFPLVVSTVPRTAAEARHLLLGWSSPDGLHVKAPSMAFKRDEPVGKATIQLARSEKGFVASDAETYAKWSQAIESSLELHEAAWNERVPCVVLPVLVVSNNTLWTVEYTANGKPGRAQAVSETTLYVGRVLTFECHSCPVGHLWICTEDGFSELLQCFEPDGVMWDDLFD